MSKGNDALYSRGKYRLAWDRRPDGTLRSPYLQIVWYDDAGGRNRSKSTTTTDIGAAEAALDRLYLERERGQTICKTCGQPINDRAGLLVSEAIANYLLAREDRTNFKAIKSSAKRLMEWLGVTGSLDLLCESVTTDTVDTFRLWAAKQKLRGGQKSASGLLSPGAIEVCVILLAAAINFSYKRRDTTMPAQFSAKPSHAVSRTPQYRCTVDELAAMFQYAMETKMANGRAMRERRADLLRFLQLSVATWARPSSVYDVSTDPARGQWHSDIRILELNPKGRAQTTKYRPALPIAERMAILLDESEGPFVKVASVAWAFSGMLNALGLPRDRETGVKLIRRSMANLVRKRLGEAQWAQGQMFLGHRRASISDLYALFDPANLGLALKATEDIIDEICEKVPGAFPDRRTFAGDGSTKLRLTA